MKSFILAIKDAFRVYDNFMNLFEEKMFILSDKIF